IRITGNAGERFTSLLAVVIVDQLLASLKPIAIEVANRNDLCTVVAPDAGQVVATRNPAHTNGSHIDAVARRVLTKNRSRNNVGKARHNGYSQATSCRGLEKMTPRHLLAISRFPGHSFAPVSLDWCGVDSDLDLRNARRPIQLQSLCLFLCLQRQLRRQETMCLCHRCLSAIKNV